jgi:hypothetical protein
MYIRRTRNGRHQVSFDSLHYPPSLRDFTYVYATTFYSKFTRLELHSIEADGTLELLEEIPIWSGISSIASVKLPVSLTLRFLVPLFGS